MRTRKVTKKNINFISSILGFRPKIGDSVTIDSSNSYIEENTRE